MQTDLSTLTIAIVDDNPKFLVAIRKVLASFNVGHVFETTDPALALAFLDAHDVDILIADRVMPQMDGLELIRAIRNNSERPLPDLAIFCVSAHGDRETLEGAIRAGADAFLAKPVRPVEIFRRLVKQVSDPLPRVFVRGYAGPDRRRGLIAAIWHGRDRRDRAA